MSEALWITWYDLPAADRDAYLSWLHGSYMPVLVERPGFLWAAHYEADERPRRNAKKDGASRRHPPAGSLPGGRRYVLIAGGESLQAFAHPTPAQFHDGLPTADRAMLALRGGATSNIMDRTDVDGASARTESGRWRSTASTTAIRVKGRTGLRRQGEDRGVDARHRLRRALALCRARCSSRWLAANDGWIQAEEGHRAGALDEALPTRFARARFDGVRRRATLGSFAVKIVDDRGIESLRIMALAWDSAVAERDGPSMSDHSRMHASAAQQLASQGSAASMRWCNCTSVSGRRRDLRQAQRHAAHRVARSGQRDPRPGGYMARGGLIRASPALPAACWAWHGRAARAVSLRLLPARGDRAPDMAGGGRRGSQAGHPRARRRRRVGPALQQDGHRHRQDHAEALTRHLDVLIARLSSRCAPAISRAPCSSSRRG